MMTSLSPLIARRLAIALSTVLAVVLILGAIPLPVHAQDGGVPVSYRLNGIRHVYQSWNNCSGANITMALSYFGWGYDQDVARAWLKPNREDKNVSPREMALFVNEGQSNLPNIKAIWRYGGNLDLLKTLIANEFPVIAESGYDVEDLGWMGHYETVVAYDDNLQTVWVYDSYLGMGEGYGMSHSYAEFDSWWRHFNRAFIVLFPVERETELRAILGNYVDPTYATQQAYDTARNEAITLNDGWAWYNMGTSLVKLGNYYDAATAFDEAFRLGMPYRTTWYRFGPFEAYYRVGRYDDVLNLVANTEATTVYVEELYFWRGMVFAAQGSYDLAIAEFDAALSYNRNFNDALAAKTAIENGTFVVPRA